jgi:hypothetical protein
VLQATIASDDDDFPAWETRMTDEVPAIPQATRRVITGNRLNPSFTTRTCGLCGETVLVRRSLLNLAGPDARTEARCNDCDDRNLDSTVAFLPSSPPRLSPGRRLRPVLSSC